MIDICQLVRSQAQFALCAGRRNGTDQAAQDGSPIAAKRTFSDHGQDLGHVHLHRDQFLHRLADLFRLSRIRLDPLVQLAQRLLQALHTQEGASCLRAQRFYSFLIHDREHAIRTRQRYQANKGKTLLAHFIPIPQANRHRDHRGLFRQVRIAWDSRRRLFKGITRLKLKRLGHLAQVALT